MSDRANPPAESLEYRTEVKQLLDILAHSLYTDRAIFLRELISNASDALNRIQFEMLTNHDVLDPEREPAIWLRPDAAARTLTVADSGVGMNRDELIENLGTIAHSGARTFLQNAAKGQLAQEEIIGQFGVGFYSVFMVAERVTVTSRSYRPGEQAWRWSSTGDSSFTLEPADKAARGTEIVIHLKEDAAEFAEPWRIESIVRKHSDYVSFPIYVAGPEQEGEPQPANRRTALWRQAPSSLQPAEYEEFYKQITLDGEPPLLYIHMVTDAPVNLRAVLFIPSKRERTRLHLRPDHGLRLYSRKVLIQEQARDLLPEYLRFVDGVVDSEDLPLNVSRETVQSNPVMRQIRRALTGRLHKELKTLAEADAEKYARFWGEFGPFLKEGVAVGPLGGVEPAGQEQLIELLRFRSSRTGESGWTSLRDYAGRMAEGQDAIYYVLGEDIKTVAHSPHLDALRAGDIEVLYLVDPIDGFVTLSVPEYDGKPLKNVDDPSLDLPKNRPQAEAPPATITPEQFDEVVKRFVAQVGERVKTVREGKQLVDSPCRLVSPDDSPDRDLQRFRRLTEENYEMPKKVLELNRRHPILAGLAQRIEANPVDPLIPAVIEQLFDNALLLEGLHANPVDMVERIQTILAAAVGPASAPSE